MKTFSALIALALAAFATASTAPAFAMSSGYWSTNSFYSVPSSLGSADRFGEASQRRRIERSILLKFKRSATSLAGR